MVTSEEQRTTTFAPPDQEVARQPWFSSTQPPPGTGPLGLGSLPPLGGMLCMYSMTRLAHHRAQRDRRSMRISPATWDTTFDNEEEVFEFWLSFSKRLDVALQAYQNSGFFPRLLWHCSVIRSRSLPPFHKGADAVLPELEVGLPHHLSAVEHTEPE